MQCRRIHVTLRPMNACTLQLPCHDSLYHNMHNFIASQIHLPLQCLLLLCVCSNISSFDKQSLLCPHSIHISLRHVLLVSQLTKILEIIFCERYPERIFIQNLKASKDKLWLGRASPTLTHLVGKSETLGYGNQCLNCEEWCTFFHEFGVDTTATTGKNIVYTTEDFCRCLNFD